MIFGHYQLNKPLVTSTKIGLDTGACHMGIHTVCGMETGEAILIFRQ